MKFFDRLLKGTELNFSNRFFDWGIYKVNNKILAIQDIHRRGGWNNGWDIYDFKYNVINSETLLKIDETNPSLSNSEQKYYKKNNDEREKLEKVLPAKFYPCDSIISVQRSWLLKEKWLWCDTNKNN